MTDIMGTVIIDEAEEKKPPENVEAPASTVKPKYEPVPVTCPDCGASVVSAERMDFHRKRCPANPANAAAVNVVVPERPAKEKVKTPPASTPTKSSTDPKKTLIEDRTRKWGSAIFNDVNPVIFAVAKTYTQVPEEWCDGPIAQFQTADGKTVTFWDPPLRDRLQFSKGDCNRIAKAAATFSVSPTGMVLAAWVEHNAGLIALGGAVVVSAKFGWNMAKTKAEVKQLKDLLESQQSAGEANKVDPEVKQSPASAA